MRISSGYGSATLGNHRLVLIGTVTIAKRFSKPVTGLGVLVNFCRKASLRLCAGSVEMMRTFLLTAAS